MNILPQTCFELSKIDNIIGIKEASGNISQVLNILNLCGDNLHIYSGNDDQILPLLSIGCKGVISVLSNVKPESVLNITNSFFNNKISEASNYQLDSLELINSLFEETNPILFLYHYLFQFLLLFLHLSLSLLNLFYLVHLFQ